MNFIYDMITSVRFCLSYNLLNAIFCLQSVFISKIIYIVTMNAVIWLHVPAESVM